MVLVQLTGWVKARLCLSSAPRWSGSTCPGPPHCAPASDSSCLQHSEAEGIRGVQPLCRALMQHLPEPQAAPGTAHSFWEAAPCHLLGHPCSAAGGSTTHTSSLRRLGQSQAVKGQFPLFLYYSLALPANKTMNLEDSLCHTKGKELFDLHVSHPPVL